MKLWVCLPTCCLMTLHSPLFFNCLDLARLGELLGRCQKTPTQKSRRSPSSAALSGATGSPEKAANFVSSPAESETGQEERTQPWVCCQKCFSFDSFSFPPLTGETDLTFCNAGAELRKSGWWKKEGEKTEQQRLVDDSAVHASSTRPIPALQWDSQLSSHCLTKSL